MATLLSGLAKLSRCEGKPMNMCTVIHSPVAPTNYYSLLPYHSMTAPTHCLNTEVSVLQQLLEIHH